ncbi:caspase family protein [Lysobacter sp. CCNWLW3]|uniref:caspase family protein n=1 Tax=unclassified Lysobacter TaxID=2635362 RepID=UPI002FD367E5
MRDVRFYLKPKYGRSHALIIGINTYIRCNPLSYAVNDATAVRDKLVKDFDFSSEDVTLLLDENATADAIRRAYLRFCNSDIELDDRLLIFFAGHGSTRSGMRGEVGYLVPVDATPDDLSTLIRWDDLTRNIEMIPAKHILFVMDACYGGLAITRTFQSGSARFLKDMLKRVSRQVLTAGKADQQVADSGGPIAGHSVFTGHLLQGLGGEAATPDGVLTASGLMSYVYGKVAADAGSFQTPHFGHIDGDGDFIFRAPKFGSDATSDAIDIDSMLVVPYPDEPTPRSDLPSKILRVKELLSDRERSIELHDFTVDEVKRFLSATGEDAFKSDGTFTIEEVIDRLTRYESHTKDLATIEACIAYWAAPSHRQILRKALARSTDRLDIRGGLLSWLTLRWYPLVIQTYCAGIASTEAGRYDTLSDLLLTEVQSGEDTMTVFRAVSRAIQEFAQAEIFKRLPGHERQYTPMSEYLFKQLQPQLDNALFMGRNYERAFDEFEIMLALVAVDQKLQAHQSAWGPVGRFGWKHQNNTPSPLTQLIDRIKAEGSKSPALQHGLFGGDENRFSEAANKCSAIVSALNWY